MARGGFIGVGNMGSLMARNLIRAGHNLKVYDLSEEAVNSSSSRMPRRHHRSRTQSSACEAKRSMRPLAMPIRHRVPKRELINWPTNPFVCLTDEGYDRWTACDGENGSN
jgi:glutamate dehydrogenase/leucine dehydrogenase